jgi:hypothetical protein
LERMARMPFTLKLMIFIYLTIKKKPRRGSIFALFVFKSLLFSGQILIHDVLGIDA